MGWSGGRTISRRDAGREGERDHVGTGAFELCVVARGRCSTEVMHDLAQGIVALGDLQNVVSLIEEDETRRDSRRNPCSQ